MIYNVNGEFVISSHRQWVPGAYDSERTAKYAFRFDNDALSKLMDAKLAEGKDVITFEDLQQLRRKQKE